jgi:hypothetical protein
VVVRRRRRDAPGRDLQKKRFFVLCCST